MYWQEALIWLLLLVAIWPVIGSLSLWWMNQVLRRKGYLPLSRATGGAEVLARMYLWPLVLLRTWRSLKKDRVPPAK